MKTEPLIMMDGQRHNLLKNVEEDISKLMVAMELLRILVFLVDKNEME